MNRFLALLVMALVLSGCKSTKDSMDTSLVTPEKKNPSQFVIAFGSCNKHDLANRFWDDIVKINPDVWIWGGDNIYADTDNMAKLRSLYALQEKVDHYAELLKNVEVIGTWDDHDYGVNDGGADFSERDGSQQAFLDFMAVPNDSPRRDREGVYTAHDYTVGDKSIKVLVLDTRFFRTGLTEDPDPNKRYRPNDYGEGTLLGKAQWQWLENELARSKADFNVIVSSIQFLSSEHTFEKWANFPHEVDRMKKLIVESGAKGVIFLSGDRHISEFSKVDMTGLSYPLIDFTSSGLTHSYTNFSGEPNTYRVGEVVATTSFGLVTLDLEAHTAFFQMMDEKDVLQAIMQQY